MVALEPLAPGCSAFEVKLRADLLKAMKSYPGAKESEAHKMINATNKTMHSFCNLYGKTIEVRLLQVLSAVVQMLDTCSVKL